MRASARGGGRERKFKMGKQLAGFPRGEPSNLCGSARRSALADRQGSDDGSSGEDLDRCEIALSFRLVAAPWCKLFPAPLPGCCRLWWRVPGVLLTCVRKPPASFLQPLPGSKSVSRCPTRISGGA